jgi:D-serine deaminase-like pyridoxal phosphate-dependent protein
LLLDLDVVEANLATMTARWPGTSLRPHAKLFKSTAFAAWLADAGHLAFCAATIREVEGLAGAGLVDDLLLANEVLDASRLGALVDDGARVTVAVDSDETVDAAAAGGVREVLVDVNVGFRCGCPPEDAGRLADRARAAGLEVRGVMAYEAHAVLVPDRAERARLTDGAMERARRAHADVGGEVVSGGGTGTWDLNDTATELQAGSFLVMDTAYAELDLPFRQALFVEATVISTSEGAAIADGGIKSLAMDHGNPTVEGAEVLYCSDEHLAFLPQDGWQPAVGDRIRVLPAHCDPTVALHDRFHVLRNGEIVDEWPIDLRGWWAADPLLAPDPRHRGRGSDARTVSRR